jgi:hypothetical protein
LEADEGFGGSGGGVRRLADMVGEDARTGANTRGDEFIIPRIDENTCEVLVTCGFAPYRRDRGG